MKEEWAQFVAWVAANPNDAAVIIAVLAFMWLVK